MANKKYGYYDKTGKSTIIIENWDDVKETNNYCGFKSKEERNEYEKDPGEFVRRRETMKRENDMIDSGKWEEYLFKNISCENLRGYDALCVSDASYDKDSAVASFGLIVIPLKDGKVGGDIIIESARLMDIDMENIRRIRYDMEGSQEEDIIELGELYIKHLEKVEKKYDKEYEEYKKGKREKEPTEGKADRNARSYVKGGEADRAESESVTRVLEICKEKGWKKIEYISDCKPLLQAIANEKLDKLGNIRAITQKKEWGGEMVLRKVGSHDKAVIGELNEFGKANSEEFANDISRLYTLLNDLADLMAKAEVRVKGGSAQVENRYSVHLIPLEDGTYVKTGEVSDINKIYDEAFTEEERRKIMREVVKRIMPLIETAISNGNK